MSQVLKAVVYRKNLLWRVKLVSSNNEITLSSEAYFSKSNAQRAAKAIKGAKIE